MIAPFNRHDSGVIAAGICMAAGFAAMEVLPGTGWQAYGLPAAAVLLALLASSWWLRRLPPDLPLRPASDAAAQQARAAPPPDAARLRVALMPEPLGLYRLDLSLDGRRIAQLRPGTAVVLPLSPGLHELTAHAWLRRLGNGELINALPGTDTDIVIRGGGGKSRHYSIERRGMAAVLADRRIVLITP